MVALTHDPHRRRRTLWFLAVNLMALVVSVGVFASILYFDGLSIVFEPILRGVFEYKIVVISIAMSPLLASLLVGMAYAKRAIRRKKAQAAQPAS